MGKWLLFVVVMGIACGLVGCGDRRANEQAVLKLSTDFLNAVKEKRYEDAYSMFSKDRRSQFTLQQWMGQWKPREADGANDFTYTLEYVPNTRVGAGNIPETVIATLTFNPTTPFGQAQKSGEKVNGIKVADKMELILAEKEGRWVVRSYGTPTNLKLLGD